MTYPSPQKQVLLSPTLPIQHILPHSRLLLFPVLFNELPSLVLYLELVLGLPSTITLAITNPLSQVLSMQNPLSSYLPVVQNLEHMTDLQLGRLKPATTLVPEGIEGVVVCFLDIPFCLVGIPVLLLADLSPSTPETDCVVLFNAEADDTVEVSRLRVRMNGSIGRSRSRNVGLLSSVSDAKWYTDARLT